MVQSCLGIPNTKVVNSPSLASVMFSEVMAVAGDQQNVGFSLAGVSTGRSAAAVLCLRGVSTRRLVLRGQFVGEVTLPEKCLLAPKGRGIARVLGARPRATAGVGVMGDFLQKGTVGLSGTARTESPRALPGTGTLQPPECN